MTVIAAWVDERDAWLAADSALVGGATVEEFRVWPAEQKIHVVAVSARRAGGWALVAAAGNASAGPLAAYLPAYPADPSRARPGSHERAVELDRWAFRCACELDAAAVAARLFVGGDSEAGLIDAAWLLAYAGRAWVLQQRAAHPVLGYTAVGTGSAYALGALAALEPHVRVGSLTPAEALGAAVRVACRYDAYCRAPVHVVNAP